MFTAEERDRLRSDLLERARSDQRISGAAITGSGAMGPQDQWSDIDLAFGVADSTDVTPVLPDWTAYMYDRHSAVHHVDVRAGSWIYRVFLLRSTLQVDLAFAPAADFRALAPTFRLVFGKANDPLAFPSPRAADLIGMAWLYALHARSSIARGRFWQAEYMVSGVRDHALAMACIRHGLPAAHGRGFDQLPAEVLAPFERSLMRDLAAELWRAFGVAVEGLLTEIESVDASLAERLREPLFDMTKPV